MRTSAKIVDADTIGLAGKGRNAGDLTSSTARSWCRAHL